MLKFILKKLHLFNFCKFIIKQIRALDVYIYYSKSKQVHKKVCKKKRINVAFILLDPAFWKNEALWVALKQNGRFNLCYWVTPYHSTDNKMRLIENCAAFAIQKKRQYFIASSLGEFRKFFRADFIFIMQPYPKMVPFTRKDIKNELICYVPYGYSNLNDDATYASPVQHYMWRFYVESEYIKTIAKNYLHGGAINVKPTGLPFACLFHSKLTNESMAWPANANSKKKIIWAPHWSIRAWSNGLFDISTFLSVSDIMLEMANKFKDSIFLICKPHPILKHVLNHDSEWGIQKTDEYFKKWETGENTAIVDGEYVDLFKQSDAMIHDCGSFILEYLLVDKPCMYLSFPNNKSNFNESTTRALECYHRGTSKNSIEQFIEDVLAGKDALQRQRKDFIYSYLRPDNQSPVDKIINDLLTP